MNLNELRDQAYKIACDHGFHDKELRKELILDSEMFREQSYFYFS